MSTPLLGLYAPVTNTDAGTWGDNWNNQGSTYLDNLIANLTTLSLSASNVLLTSSQARNQMVRCTGTLLAAVDISPDVAVLWNGARSVENLTTGNFALTITNSAGTVTIPQGRRCTVFLDTTNGPRITGIAGTNGADAVPSATIMPFYMNAAPTGWTISSSLNDCALKIVSSAGGVTSGSVAYSTLFGRTTTDSHTLTSNEIPSHNHAVVSAGARHGSAGTNAGSTFYASDGDVSSSGVATQTITSAATGGGNGHTHDIDMRVLTASFILASRN